MAKPDSRQMKLEMTKFSSSLQQRFAWNLQRL
jgi:hypothetical protein